MTGYIKHVVSAISLSICCSMSHGVQAETGSLTVASDGTMTSSARLKLRVVIPRFLQFQVGSNGASIDTIEFLPATAAVGNSVPVAGSGGETDNGSGTSVVLRSNAGQITIVADNDGGSGGLGSGGAISLSEIAVHSDSSDLQTPPLSDAGATTARATLTGGRVTDHRAIWSYTYSNNRAVEPGSYEAEIVYTAISP
jgi:hypothetical protein